MATFTETSDRPSTAVAVHRSGRRQARDRQRHLRQGSGHDTVEGNGGDDIINVGDGTNTGLGRRAGHGGLGQQGDDRLNGGKGVDELYGGPLNDLVDGGLESDKLYGDGGVDKVARRSRHHRCAHRADRRLRAPRSPLDEADLIVGGAGNDTLNGGSGDDKIYGDEKTSLALRRRRDPAPRPSRAKRRATT